MTARLGSPCSEITLRLERAAGLLRFTLPSWGVSTWPDAEPCPGPNPAPTVLS